MRTLQAIVAAAIALTCTEPCRAQPAAPPSDPSALREVAIDNLLAERGPLDRFEILVTRARELGVSPQAILEARFLYHVDQLDDPAIAAMLPDFLEQQKHFKITDSAIFAVEEDWLAVIEFVKAMAALQQGDKQAFKQHITEAFWLGPRQASAFAPHIERLRHDEAMRAITIDFNTEVSPFGSSTTTPLKQLIADRRALLIHFWSPHSRECDVSMPDFTRTAAMLAQHRIAVLSLCPDDSPQAREIIRPYQSAAYGTWAIDSDTHPLGSLLRIQVLPTMALINPLGTVLYSGDPTDDRFWKTLQQLDPEISRPESAE